MHVIDRQRELFQQDNARPHTVRVAMDGVDPESEVEVVAGAHVYPADPIGVQVRRFGRPWKHIDAVLLKGAEQCWPRVVVMHGTNFNVTGSVLNCGKLTFSLLIL
jgi:hypothetical protein